MPEGPQAGDGGAHPPPLLATSCFSFISEQRARPVGGHSRNPFLRCIPHLRHCCRPAKGLFTLADNTQREPKCSTENARPGSRQRPQAQPLSHLSHGHTCPGVRGEACCRRPWRSARSKADTSSSKMAEQMGDNLTFLLSSSYRLLGNGSSLGPSLRAARHMSAGPSRKAV